MDISLNGLFNERTISKNNDRVIIIDNQTDRNNSE